MLWIVSSLSSDLCASCISECRRDVNVAIADLTILPCPIHLSTHAPLWKELTFHVEGLLVEICTWVVLHLHWCTKNLAYSDIYPVEDRAKCKVGVIWRTRDTSSTFPIVVLWIVMETLHIKVIYIYPSYFHGSVHDMLDKDMLECMWCVLQYVWECMWSGFWRFYQISSS